MTKITYTITRHWYQDGKARQLWLFKNIESKETAQKLIKSARLQNKRLLLSAKKKGDKDLYDHLFQETYSITTNITSLCPDPTTLNLKT